MSYKKCVEAAFCVRGPKRLSEQDYIYSFYFPLITNMSFFLLVLTKNFGNKLCYINIIFSCIYYLFKWYDLNDRGAVFVNVSIFETLSQCVCVCVIMWIMEMLNWISRESLAPLVSVVSIDLYQKSPLTSSSAAPLTAPPWGLITSHLKNCCVHAANWAVKEEFLCILNSEQKHVMMSSCTNWT